MSFDVTTLANPVEWYDPTIPPWRHAAPRDWAAIPRTTILPGNSAIPHTDPHLCKCCARCTELKLIKSARLDFGLSVVTNEKGEKQMCVGRTSEESAPRLLLDPPTSDRDKLRRYTRFEQTCEDRCTHQRHAEERYACENQSLETDWVKWRAYHTRLYDTLRDEQVTFSSLFE